MVTVYKIDFIHLYEIDFLFVNHSCTTNLADFRGKRTIQQNKNNPVKISILKMCKYQWKYNFTFIKLNQFIDK